MTAWVPVLFMNCFTLFQVKTERIKWKKSISDLPIRASFCPCNYVLRYVTVTHGRICLLPKTMTILLYEHCFFFSPQVNICKIWCFILKIKKFSPFWVQLFLVFQSPFFSLLFNNIFKIFLWFHFTVAWSLLHFKNF